MVMIGNGTGGGIGATIGNTGGASLVPNGSGGYTVQYGTQSRNATPATPATPATTLQSQLAYAAYTPNPYLQAQINQAKSWMAGNQNAMNMPLQNNAPDLHVLGPRGGKGMAVPINFVQNVRKGL